jgi:hypothetical protein
MDEMDYHRHGKRALFGREIFLASTLAKRNLVKITI